MKSRIASASFSRARQAPTHTLLVRVRKIEPYDRALLPSAEACRGRHRYCRTVLICRLACRDRRPESAKSIAVAQRDFPLDRRKIEAEVFRTNITFPARDNFTGVRSRQDPRNQQIANDFLGICGIEFIDHPKPDAHGQLRPGSLNRVTSEKYHLHVRKLIDDSFDDLIVESRVGRRNVTR